MRTIYTIFIAMILATAGIYDQYDLKVISINNSTSDSLYMKTGVSDTLWRKVGQSYNVAYVAKQWAYFPFFQQIPAPTTLAGYGITDGLTTSAAAGAYQPVGNYATGGGTATGTNTGDNAANTTYANDYRAANFISGTHYLAPNGNGSSLTGLTASQVGLANVTNESKATMFTNAVFTGTATGIGIPVYAQVTGSNATTTGQALTDITGLSVALTTNAVYEFEAVMTWSTTAVTTGIGYGVNYSAAGATVEAYITASSTATATKTLRISALNTSAQAFLTGSAQTGGILIKGRVTTGANAGNLTIQHLKVTSGTSTIFIGSFLKVIRIS